MNKCLIGKEVSKHVLMAGNYYKHHHPGGISAVVQYWAEYIDGIQYYPTYRLSNVVVRMWWFLTSYVRMAVRLCFDKDVKIVHLHSAADGSFWRKAQIVRLAKMFGVKVVFHVHASRFKDFYNEASESKKAWIRSVLTKSDMVIALSHSWKEWFAGIGVEDDKIVVLHNITSYPVVRESDRVNDGKTHFLFMGEIGKRKGVFDLIDVLARHREEFEGRLELRIGGNRCEEQLKRAIADGGLENMVKFEGWVGGDKKIALLNWTDVFVLPSYNEGLPISILEAMSYGRPVVSTTVGGIPEVVSTDKNGVLIAPGDKDALYGAIKKYVDNPSVIGQEGAVSKDVAREYLPDYVLGHLKCIYQNLLA
jgi:glycosyltransferase involved in cell wall biosynthesis